MSVKIRSGDEVVIIAGKHNPKVDGLKRGKVLKVLSAHKVVRVIVEGLNMIKKHKKPNPNLNEPGGIIEQEAPIHISNVAIYNHKTGLADRVGFRFDADNKKVRFFKSNNTLID